MPNPPIRIVAEGPAGTVPALLFLPRSAPEGPLPLVLVGHGAHLSKDDPVMQTLARAFTRVPAGVALMDCPGHGERRAPGLTEEEFDAAVQAYMGDPATTGQLAQEWLAIAAAVRRERPEIDGPVGYAGFSMGAIYGLSMVGDLPEVRAAVFALGGLVHPDRRWSSARNEMIRAGAARLGEREVLMLNMTRDEHFPIEGAIEVFESIPGPKRMAVWHGGHVDIPPEAIGLALDFFRRTLAAG
jgi:dienelactone hydrolase